jgi:N-acetyl-gamma-glutamyl-phosphate reductase
VEAALVDPAHLIADAKSGVSGAGRKAQLSTLMSETGESFKAYGVAGHRHLPEIAQGLERIAGGPVSLTFVPHLTPMVRGIHATLYGRLLDTSADLQSLYEERYRNERFVDVLGTGAHPDTRNTRGANTCQIAVHRPQGGDTVVVLSVIDNLVKGAAGQAVQNMNLICGFGEGDALDLVALYP